MKTNPCFGEEEAIIRLQVLKRELHSSGSRSELGWGFLGWGFLGWGFLGWGFLGWSSVVCECQGDVEVVLRKGAGLLDPEGVVT